MTRAVFEDYVAHAGPIAAQRQMARAEAVTVGTAGRKAARSWWREMEKAAAALPSPGHNRDGTTRLTLNGKVVTVRQLAASFGVAVEGES